MSLRFSVQTDFGNISKEENSNDNLGERISGLV